MRPQISCRSEKAEEELRGPEVLAHAQIVSDGLSKGGKLRVIPQDLPSFCNKVLGFCRTGVACCQLGVRGRHPLAGARAMDTLEFLDWVSDDAVNDAAVESQAGVVNE
eukprot:2705001-Amphidinium_carterae.1